MAATLRPKLPMVERSLALCTSLTPEIGYEAAAELAKFAFQTDRTIREIARENMGIPDARLEELLDILAMTGAKRAQTNGTCRPLQLRRPLQNEALRKKATASHPVHGSGAQNAATRRGVAICGPAAGSHLEHVRHGRGVRGVPAAVDLDAMPSMWPVVAAFGVVRELMAACQGLRF